MSTISTNGGKVANAVRKNKFQNTLKKVLLCTVAMVAVVVGLVVLYQILEFLFVATVLLIGCIGVAPRRWR